jgi:transposase InsO family protein
MCFLEVVPEDRALMRWLDERHLECPFAGARRLSRMRTRKGRPVGRRHGSTLNLFAVLDWASRRVVSWRLSNTVPTDCCMEAGPDAIHRYGKPALFNTDQSGPFTRLECTGLLADHDIQSSMEGDGCWRDHVFVERFWRSVHYAEVHRQARDSVSEAQKGLERYVMRYPRGGRTRRLTATPRTRAMLKTCLHCPRPPRHHLQGTRMKTEFLSTQPEPLSWHIVEIWAVMVRHSTVGGLADLCE